MEPLSAFQKCILQMVKTVVQRVRQYSSVIGFGKVGHLKIEDARANLVINIGAHCKNMSRSRLEIKGTLLVIKYDLAGIRTLDFPYTGMNALLSR